MARKKLNALGHVLVTEWLGKNWYRDDQGRITDDKGDYAGDKINKVINDTYPAVAPSNIDKQKRPEPRVEAPQPQQQPEQQPEQKRPGPSAGDIARTLSQDALKAMFPGVYSAIKYYNKITNKGDGDSKEDREKAAQNLKRSQEERKRQYEQVIDKLDELNDSMDQVVALQRESAGVLSKVAELLIERQGQQGTGGGIMGMLGSLLGGGRTAATALGGSSIVGSLGVLGSVVGAGLLGGGAYYLSTRKKADALEPAPKAPSAPEATPAPAPPAPSMDVANAIAAGGGDMSTVNAYNQTAPTPTAVAPSAGGSIAEGKESAAIKEAKAKKTRGEDVLKFEADQISFKADRLTFDVDKLTIQSKENTQGQQQQQQQQASGNSGPGGGSGSGSGGDTGAGAGTGTGSGAGSPIVNNPSAGAPLPSPQEAAMRTHAPPVGSPMSSGITGGPGGITAAPSRAPNKGLAANQQEAYTALRAEGLSESAARIAVANLSGEALGKPGDVHADPSRRNPNQKAHGIASWDDSRSERIRQKFGKMPNEMTVAEQAKAFAWELKTYYHGTYEKLTDEKMSETDRMYGLVKGYEAPARPEQDTAIRLGKLHAMRVEDEGTQGKPPSQKEEQQAKTEATSKDQAVKTDGKPAPVPAPSGMPMDATDASTLKNMQSGLMSWTVGQSEKERLYKNHPDLDPANEAASRGSSLSTYKGQQGTWEKSDTGGAKFVPVGEALKSASPVPTAPAKPAPPPMPDYGKSDEEYRREYNKPAKEPSPKAQQSSHKKPHPSRVESSSPMPTDPGGDMVVRLASMLPYLALAVVTGQHQASHSIMQSRRRR